MFHGRYGNTTIYCTTDCRFYSSLFFAKDVKILLFFPTQHYFVCYQICRYLKKIIARSGNGKCCRTVGAIWLAVQIPKQRTSEKKIATSCTVQEILRTSGKNTAAVSCTSSAYTLRPCRLQPGSLKSVTDGQNDS